MKFLAIVILAAAPFASGMNIDSGSEDRICEMVERREREEWIEYQKQKEIDRLSKYVNAYVAFQTFEKYDLDIDRYISTIAHHESRDSYLAINKYTGALGRYQFMPSTLSSYLKKKRLTVDRAVTEKVFLQDTTLQDAMMIEFMRRHILSLERSGLIDYVGTTHRGIDITVEGLLAGAHLGGLGGLKSFMRGDDNRKDIHNTSVGDYIGIFN
jgi:hypothetical protein